MERLIGSCCRLCFLLGVVISLAVAGCGPDENKQVSSNPTGDIVGVVTATVDGSPLAGVEVVVYLSSNHGASPKTVTTDEDGTYALRNLPSGVIYTVRFRHPEYVTAIGLAALPNDAGEYPQGNVVATLDMMMARPDATLTGTVFGTEGAPAVGAVVRVDLRDIGFDLVLEDTAGADGKYRITGLPGAPAGLGVVVVVAPYDEDGDGESDFGALILPANLFPGATTVLDLDLRTAANVFVMLWSSLDDGLHPADAPIEATFNRDVDLAGTTATLVDTDLGVSNVVIITADPASPGALSLETADGLPLTAGHDYTLTINARSAFGQRTQVVRAFVAAGDPADLAVVQNLAFTPEDVDWNTVHFNLTWDTVPNAASYRVFVRDNRFYTTFQQIASVGNSPTPGVGFDLPAVFDVFSGDGRHTPFAYHGEVSFAVVPVDNLGQLGDLGAAVVASTGDIVAPRITGSVQTGSADNSAGGAPLELTLEVTFREYMDGTVPFTLSTQGAGVTSTFELEPDLLHGTFTVTIPAGVDARGGFQITDGADTSGNPLEPYDGQLRAQRELVVNGDFGTGQFLPNWIASTSGTVDPTPVNEAGNWIGCLGSTTISQTGISTLYQDIAIPGGLPTDVNVSLRYRILSNQNNSDNGYCEITTTGGTTLVSLFDVWATIANTTYHQVNLNTNNLNGRTSIRLICALEQGFGVFSTMAQLCVDDLSIIAWVP